MHLLAHVSGTVLSALKQDEQNVGPVFKTLTIQGHL